MRGSTVLYAVFDGIQDKPFFQNFGSENCPASNMQCKELLWSNLLPDISIECIVEYLKTNYCKNKTDQTCEAVMYVYKYQLTGTLTRCHLTMRSTNKFMIITKHVLLYDYHE